MPALGDIATSVILGDGESAVVTWVPSAEVEISQGTFGEQYTFFVLDENGEPAKVKGGSRLINAWKKAIAKAPSNAKQIKLRVTARNEAGTIKRDWEVELL